MRRFRHAPSAADQRGFTLVEIIVTLFAGTVIMLVIFAVLDLSVRQSASATDRVEAGQRGRTAMEQLVQELHSSCVAASVTPVLAGSADTPTFKGTYTAGANSLQPPPTDAQLKQIAQPAYQWTGQTHIPLNGSSMTVTNNGAASTVPFPSNGVVYVSTSSCSTTYTPFGVTYPGASGCGTITVDGNYSSSLTLASDNDILIDGNITHSGSALLGLIAQNYVRIYHPCSNSSNQPGALTNVSADAAILALTGSFIVDNYDCGASLGTLTINGAIAQVFRGPVGTFGSQPTGYLKNYTYDDRLREQEPPHFLNPIQAAWRVQRETECARGSTSCP
jgi:prepilin-type N-terminal cleavage/methylation domain-containing protein